MSWEVSCVSHFPTHVFLLEARGVTAGPQQRSRHPPGSHLERIPAAPASHGLTFVELWGPCSTLLEIKAQTSRARKEAGGRTEWTLLPPSPIHGPGGCVTPAVIPAALRVDVRVEVTCPPGASRRSAVGKQGPWGSGVSSTARPRVLAEGHRPTRLRKRGHGCRTSFNAFQGNKLTREGEAAEGGGVSGRQPRAWGGACSPSARRRRPRRHPTATRPACPGFPGAVLVSALRHDRGTEMLGVDGEGSSRPSAGHQPPHCRSFYSAAGGGRSAGARGEAGAGKPAQPPPASSSETRVHAIIAYQRGAQGAQSANRSAGKPSLISHQRGTHGSVTLSG